MISMEISPSHGRATGLKTVFLEQVYTAYSQLVTIAGRWHGLIFTFVPSIWAPILAPQERVPELEPHEESKASGVQLASVHAQILKLMTLNSLER